MEEEGEEESKEMMMSRQHWVEGRLGMEVVGVEVFMVDVLVEMAVLMSVVVVYNMWGCVSLCVSLCVSAHVWE